MQKILAVRGEFNKYFAMVLIVVPAFHCPVFHETIHEFYSAVMMKAKPVGKRRDGRANSFRQSLDRKQKLMLLGFDALESGCFLAEAKKLTDATPKFRELPVARNRDVLAVCFPANILAAQSHLNNPPFLSYHDRICRTCDLRDSG